MFFYDFYFFYAASVILHSTHSSLVYDLATFERTMYEVGFPLSERVTNVLPFPPFALYLFYPLAFFNIKIALLLWSSSALAVTYFSVRWWINEMRKQGLTLEPAAQVLAVVGFFPFLKMVTFGQISWLMLLWIVLATRSYNVRHFLCGVFSGLLFVKLHLFLPFISALIVSHVKHRRYTYFIGMGAVVVLQVLIAESVFKLDHVEYLSTLNSFFYQRYELRQVTLPHFLHHILGLPNLHLPLAIFGILLGVFYGLNLNQNTLIFKVLPCSLIFAPYGWSQDSLPLVFAYLYYIALLFRHAIHLAPKLITVTALICLVTFSLSLRNEIYLLLIPVVLFALSFMQIKTMSNMAETKPT